MKKLPAKMPWERELAELTKYDWLTAVGVHSVHKNCSLDLRVANVLMQKADASTCLMWATQQTIARLAGASDERQIRKAMARLEKTGAIVKKRISNLQEEALAALEAKMTGNRNKRGVVYTLRLFWAMETFEAYMKTRPTEPIHLQNARAGDRTTAVRDHRTMIDRPEQDNGSPAYTTSQNYNDTMRGSDREKDLASTREDNLYAKAKGKAA